MARDLPLAVAPLIVSGAILFVACSSSDDAPPPVPSHVDASLADASVATDGAPAPSDAAPSDPCQGLTLESPTQSELRYREDPLPALGGTLNAGTYDLSELDLYVGAPPRPDAGYDPFDAGFDPDAAPDDPLVSDDGRTARATMRVTADTLAILEAYGVDGGVPDAPTVRGFKVRTNGDALILTPVCPTSSAQSITLHYSVLGKNSITLFTDDQHTESYQRRP